MTIIAENPIKAVAAPSQVQQKVIASLQKRHRKERLFRALGLSAVLISLALVAVLFINIFAKGLPAFWQSTITLDIYFDPKIIKVPEKPVQAADESDNDYRQRDLAWQTQLGFINFNRLITDSLQQILPDAAKHRRDLGRIVTSGERFALRDMVVADPVIIGQTRSLQLLTDANIDVWLKGNIDRSLPDEQQQLSPKMREWVDKYILIEIHAIFNRVNNPVRHPHLLQQIRFIR